MTQTTVHLPEEKVTRVGDRHLTTMWTLQYTGGDKEFVVQVSTMHYKERKVFLSVVRNVTIERRNGYSTESTMLFDSTLLQRVAVSRFSQKALDAAHDKAVQVFEDLVRAGDPTLTKYLEVKVGE